MQKVPCRPSPPVRHEVGLQLHQPSGYFNLGDPCCRLLSTEYNSLHDPHLRAYHQRKNHLHRLKTEGRVTGDSRVVCTLKEFNDYRHYLSTLKLEAVKMSMREQFQEQLDKSNGGCALPGRTDVPPLLERRLQQERKRLPGGQRKRRQR
ncbi:fibrous sheath-interacting protein 2-like [Opisthocomus hoazin]|uniref:fibrous sheath-interacting protein 2-like n=1 Tax=Opisthocomus hoazin TaxID=30419 RepID=UPI003F5389C4